MKSTKKGCEIHKSVVSDPGTREDLLIFLSFNMLVPDLKCVPDDDEERRPALLVIHYVFISRSNNVLLKYLVKSRFSCY